VRVAKNAHEQQIPFDKLRAGFRLALLAQDDDAVKDDGMIWEHPTLAFG
jgi:hypothetical protein